MSDLKQELISFRLGRANEAFTMATAAVEKKYWNSAANLLRIVSKRERCQNRPASGGIADQRPSIEHTVLNYF